MSRGCYFNRPSGSQCASDPDWDWVFLNGDGRIIRIPVCLTHMPRVDVDGDKVMYNSVVVCSDVDEAMARDILDVHTVMSL